MGSRAATGLTAESISRSVTGAALEGAGELLHNLLHDPGHRLLARRIISNFFNLT